MLTVLYFASLREEIGTDREELERPEEVNDVGDLARHLAGTGDGKRKVLLDDNRVLVAVNQTIVDRTEVLRGDEEVAFFPPVTGG